MADPRPIRVLAVDDEETNLAVLAALLKAAGCAVSAVRSGQEALTAAARTAPDIILLDVQMPGMDGYATATALARQDRTRGIPVVMVTGLTSPEDKVKALKAGAVDFLSKPVQPEELTAKVRSLVRLKAYTDDLQAQRTALLAQVAGKSGELKDALSSFARFVPSEFLGCLSKKSAVDVALGDQVLTEMSILFSDIRSFTTLSEKLSPAQTFGFLNSYFRRMNPFVWENEGFIDKYIGDAIMALFPTGAAAALNAAIGMLGHIPEYNAHRASVGYPPIRIGVGIHAGPVMLGIIGHERFLQGTVISDAVNLASRLEGLTKTYGVPLVISNDVLFGLPDPNRYAFRFLDRVQVKGKEKLVSVYEVYDGDAPALRSQKDATRETFQKGVFAFHAGDVEGARALFDSVGKLPVPDRPIEIYKARCERSLRLGTLDRA